MDRTGLDATGSMAAILSVVRPLFPSMFLIRATFRGKRNGQNWSVVFGVKKTRYFGP
jgi:hypothetical protein